MSRASINAFEATVIGIEDLSPAFRRITFGGPGLAGFGVTDHPRDLRIKLVIPPGGTTAPAFDLVGFFSEQAQAGTSWYQAWLQLDEALRGCMRTYTVREWRDEARELVVDMVLHTDEAGHSGPAASWAETAEIGRRLHIIGPSRDHDGDYGGIEFRSGDADQLLLAGDETAVPAIASILESLVGGSVRGKAVIEVPSPADVLDLTLPDGFEIEWLPRGDAEFGAKLEPAVRAAVKAERRVLAEVGGSGSGVELPDVDIDSEILWDVPSQLSQAAQSSSSDSTARPFYAWIAGEAGPVKRLRRYLVQEIGVDRKQVAFMGYWRQGKAEG